MMQWQCLFAHTRSVTIMVVNVRNAGCAPIDTSHQDQRCLVGYMCADVVFVSDTFPLNKNPQ